MDYLRSVLLADCERLPQVLENAMFENPKHWANHYEASDRIGLHFGLADRTRYYWPVPKIEDTVARLFSEISSLNIPEYVFAEVFDENTVEIAKRNDGLSAISLARASVQRALEPYFFGGTS